MTWIDELDKRYLVHRRLDPLFGVWLAWDVRTEIIGNDIGIPEYTQHDDQYWWWAIGVHFHKLPGMIGDLCLN